MVFEEEYEECKFTVYNTWSHRILQIWRGVARVRITDVSTCNYYLSTEQVKIVVKNIWVGGGGGELKL